MRQTFMANEANIERKWYVIDAEGKTLGRLSSEVAAILRGKNKVTYTPHVDSGDYVIIVNAAKIQFTGNKEQDKMYYRHSNHPGGIKSVSAGELKAKNPERLLETSIKGMLPSTRLGEKQGKKLFVYGGAEHPHAAQQPENYELRG
ncbi:MULTISPECIES: 50S ribosomal protein L13 [Staphylococcus]|jgi:large subunit ribosomal protein L13|uniref:50S ribosomal protein L13 n=1 Tax=Staphylococcus TaxID=1279 RepID=UPI000E6969AD|nr:MULTISPECIES: 50S ribosomal protein L13 [Staphylococcus]MBO1205853.1 50S ribosomal protein L13 [Staphylococcus nepalensis]MCY1037962.1 50S ribosomal protein L13 [Staphylococcus nepalensis]MDW8552180.1 50S ribosomal protein L13 [Staphylococcus nepalensis]RIO45109.1 50S ribosomal protein L13 [Staphylococcus nepalensis]WQL20964.1 50S ribosomal protein L13 [Staphylococcus nepalensis]